MKIFTSITATTITLAPDFTPTLDDAGVDAVLQALQTELPQGVWTIRIHRGKWAIASQMSGAVGISKNLKIALANATGRSIAQMVPLKK
jgi:hypothetical protein